MPELRSVAESKVAVCDAEPERSSKTSRLPRAALKNMCSPNPVANAPGAAAVAEKTVTGVAVGVITASSAG